jgi:phenylalanine-4-hydroxylase
MGNEPSVGRVIENVIYNHNKSGVWNMTLYDQVIASLTAEDFDAFIPLLGSGMLFSLEESDLFSLVIDSELNLLKMIMLTMQYFEEELMKYNTDYFFNVDAFITFRLYRYPLQDLRFPIIDIMKDSRVLDYSLLVTYHIIRSIDYETLVALYEDPLKFKRFLEYLLDEYKRDEEWRS